MSSVLHTPSTRNCVDGSQVGNKNTLEVRSHMFVSLLGADAVEDGSNQYVIFATAHAVIKGNLIRFTSGVNSGVEVTVLQVLNANSFKIETLEQDPAVADTFNVYEFVTPTATGGAIDVNTSGGTKSSIATSYNDYGTTPVDNTTWVQLIASLPAAVSQLQIYDTSGEVMEIGIGAAAAETRIIIVPRGGNGEVNINIPIATRISIRSITGTANVASTENIINFLG